MTTPTIASGTGAWTPGPWEAHGLSVDAHGRGTIATIPTPQTGGVMECMANARLIAAAPELYRELDELVEWLHNNQRCVEGMFSMDDLLEGPRAALAKAEGRNP